MHTRFWSILGVAVSAVSASAEAQGGRGFLFGEPVATFSVHGGLAMPGASSDLFTFTTDELTLDRSDFNAIASGADLAIRVGSRVDLVLGLAAARSSRRSEFRDWVDNNDQPIEQVTQFSRTPIGGGLRYHLRERGRTIGSFAWIPAPFDPWVGAGVGMMKYRFRQTGDFIDYQTLNVFSDQFDASGWSPFAQASVGAGWSLSHRWVLTGEIRYLRASADLSDDFLGFERLDLSGIATQFGIAIRF